MSLKTTVFRALHKVCQAGVWLMLLALMLVGHSAVQAREASFMDAWVIPPPSRAYRLGETVNIPIVIEKGFPWRSARITLNSQKKKQDWEPDPSVVHFSEVTLGEEANGRWASVAYLPVTVKGEGMFNIEGQIHPQGFQGYGKDAVVGFRLGIFSFEGKVFLQEMRMRREKNSLIMKWEKLKLI